MRVLVHLSDLHFGRVDQDLLAPLTALVERLEPDVVVVSGDLTQRARGHEFRAARAFLDRLPGPQIVVPGNHDVPLYNLASRFLAPLVKYRRYVTPDLTPEYVDDEIAVLGINTARSLTVKDGRISHEQIALLRSRLDSVPSSLTKIIVTHHPFDLPPHFARRELVDRAPLAVDMFAACGVDLLLAGHLHASHAGNTAQRYKIDGYAALMVQAGTATSTRGRGESNSFNALRIEPDEITVERYRWPDGGSDFTLASSETFQRSGGVWSSNRLS
ncbi:metallophosphoesterase family protein [Janthinobacterium agaricidamnosum]|uniref:Calcineurin-like phosphoesterase family protein n=1 Tax=Janthinobacterium agaricidamnosum NBRC 102515 = DSM 9628 TaxID=1349767 RepID=W0VAJ4_9BURK|nr:metallophosphoesterase [Janthinobacterium agaricidamnosum]CDG84378.1 calcineurin-like phosphoesterase family protein [Janthinobacterium agaricidamnosum NBRC 102515 = DSM 9628]